MEVSGLKSALGGLHKAVTLRFQATTQGFDRFTGSERHKTGRQMNQELLLFFRSRQSPDNIQSCTGHS